ncbi:MAG: COX15/CtaA family protein, partial [Bdellovibrionaceae bacterium]|nr:COX15/CtaA family protein [Pseudobdellovibrionaceae bacterium]
MRISHSGDGCGDSWPLCHGELIPQVSQGKTWVEFSHRLTSGLFGLLVLALFLWSRRLYPVGHIVRKAALWTLFFTITEALLGAKLVLFGLVGNVDSLFRLITMSLHQVNSLVLSGCVSWLLLAAQDRCAPNVGAALRKQIKSLLIFLLVATSGAWAALSTTLFPSESLWEGLLTDFHPDSHWLLKLRAVHPVLGLLLGGSLSAWLWQKGSLENQAASATMSLLVVIGMLTLLMLSPLPMKVLHLSLIHI